MQILPNNCRVGKISVYPKNWKDGKADKNLIWKISYRFYDDNSKEILKVVIKDVNRIDDLKEKQDAIETLLADEKEALKNGYNPILKKYIGETGDDELNPDISFVKALELAHKDLKVVHQFWIDIRSTIKYVSQAARDLHFDKIPIKDIRRKHIKRILDRCGEIKERWSPNRFNAYRQYLGLLFKQLLEIEVIEVNPVRDLAKQKTIKKIKKLPTPKECRAIDQFTKKYDRRFWLLINSFFHSGCRTTEIFRVKRKHVDLVNQTVLITVLKGNQPFEVLKPIKNIAVKFWKEAIKSEKGKEAKAEDYIFSKGLQPGPEPISPRQATIRWRRHIKGDKKKGKLGISCNWYDLKYLNSDQIDKQKGLQVAARMNSHKSIRTTKIYAVNNEDREMEEIRKMKNAFG